MAARVRFLNTRLQDYTSTIFSEMSALAVATGSINLGQGFPDTDGPETIKRAAIRAIESGHNQYPPVNGITELREAISRHQLHYRGLEFVPDSEIVVTAGATEAIAASLLALCEPGDDVVLFEPYYDAYAACTAMAGAQRRVVQLRAPDWSFDHESLEERDHRSHSAHHREHPAQSDRQGLQSRRTRDHRRRLSAPRPHRRHRRGLRTPDLRVSACFAGDTRGYGGAHDHGFVGRQDVLVHRMEGRLGVRAAGSGRAVRTAKQFLTFVNGAPFQYAIAEGLTRER